MYLHRKLERSFTAPPIVDLKCRAFSRAVLPLHSLFDRYVSVVHDTAFIGILADCDVCSMSSITRVDDVGSESAQIAPIPHT